MSQGQIVIPSLAELQTHRSEKWRGFAHDVLPLPVAEMDFPVADPIREVLLEMVKTSDLGYLGSIPELGTSFAGFAKRRWDWSVDPLHVRVATDVGVAIVELLRVFTKPGDKVLFSSPIYQNFYTWMRETHVEMVDVPFKTGVETNDQTGWSHDWVGIEAAYKSGIVVHLLCSPHNPLGKVYNREDLLHIAELAKQYGVIVISDEIHAKYDALSKEELEATKIEVSLGGRIMTRRIMGKASFVTISDMGGKIQLYVARDSLAEGVYNDQFKKWDLGDIIGATGHLFKTQTGELTVWLSDIRLLTKALRPLPDKFHGLTDNEARYRQRYLDLISNEQSRHTFLVRSKTVAYIRKFFNEEGFLEVETPMLQAIPGGASARPFETHHNALDMQMFLRIAPELYLKRLVVGGFEKVFELNRNFRNEGVSTRHNPEFTMLEFYWAYADYNDLMDITEELFRGLAQSVLGTTEVPYQGNLFDFGKPFARMSVTESILHYNPEVKIEQLTTREAVATLAKSLGIEVKANYGHGRILMEVFDELVETKLQQPTFITEYPAEISPLARRNDHNPEITDRFEFFIGGRELGNGFSELNDAEDQAERFREQVAQKEAGDDEAMYYDEDFVTALEHGLPPTAGQGIGIDRLVMLLADAPSIRDVILFPHMRHTDKHGS